MAVARGGAKMMSVQELPPRPVPLQRASCRVLVADDHGPLNEMISDALRSAGYEVDQASDGGSALELLRAGEYCAGVIDVRMPDMDGFQLLAQARAERLECAMIVISVVADAETRRRVTELGAVFHQKLFELTDLLADVQRACDD
ncbi:MAG: two-component system, NtrC family, nitrogen regulation response regulator NtrX, partial [Gaiellales bacterium]|nr:two-component system, NtrC family, nitrogen regulation response regulator NtrX [Gaiellales bacterium]